MLVNTRIAFIGSGVMAEAMITGLLRTKVTSADCIIASGPRVDRGDYLREKYYIGVTTDNVEALREAGVVVLSVKPQMLATVISDLHGAVPPEALVLFHHRRS